MDNEEPCRPSSVLTKKSERWHCLVKKIVPTPCPCSFSLLFSGAKTKRPDALEPGIQSSRSMVEMITRLTMSQRSFPFCCKNPFLAPAQYLNRGQLPQTAIFDNFFCTTGTVKQGNFIEVHFFRLKLTPHSPHSSQSLLQAKDDLTAPIFELRFMDK